MHPDIDFYDGLHMRAVLSGTKRSLPSDEESLLSTNSGPSLAILVQVILHA